MILPLYLEDRFFQDYPPRINRPEFYYGFAGITLAWQFMFLVIASDPVRYRLAMLPSLVEKASFAVAIPILYAADRVTGVWLGFAAMDAHAVMGHGCGTMMPTRSSGSPVAGVAPRRRKMESSCTSTPPPRQSNHTD